MTNGLIGRKLGMTQVCDDAGRMIPVTVIERGIPVRPTMDTETSSWFRGNSMAGEATALLQSNPPPFGTVVVVVDVAVVVVVRRVVPGGGGALLGRPPAAVFRLTVPVVLSTRRTAATTMGATRAAPFRDWSGVCGSSW